MAFVEFRDVTKIYQTGQGAFNVSFSIEEGDFVFLLGKAAPENQRYLSF